MHNLVWIRSCGFWVLVRHWPHYAIEAVNASGFGEMVRSRIWWKARSWILTDGTYSVGKKWKWKWF